MTQPDLIFEDCEEAQSTWRYSKYAPIVYDKIPPEIGKQSTVSLRDHTQLIYLFQYCQPLTMEHPCFSVEVVAIGATSKLSIGLGNSSMRDDVHVGNHSNTIGYHNDTGSVVSSHSLRYQSKPEAYTTGDVITVMLVSSPETLSYSTIVFFKNNIPQCTKYHHEPNSSQFNLSVSMENGPMQLKITYPTAMQPDKIPSLSMVNPDHWMYCHNSMVLTSDFLFTAEQTDEENKLVSLQSPLPLTAECPYYELEIVRKFDCENELILCLVSPGAQLISASCHFSETVKFSINNRNLKSGDRIGCLIQRVDNIQTGGHNYIVLMCYFIVNGRIKYRQCAIEPPGGFYPFIIFMRKSLQIRMNVNSKTPTAHLPNKQLLSLLESQRDQLQQQDSNFTIKKADLSIIATDHINYTVKTQTINVTVELSAPRLQSIMLKSCPLTQNQPIYQINITKLGEESVICVGLATDNQNLNRYPGRSVGSIGYHSRDGKILYDGRSHANTIGHPFDEGDEIIIEACFTTSNESITVRIWKNSLPITLRYLRRTDPDANFYPFISIYANGFKVDCDIIPPKSITRLPAYFVNDALYWCLPYNSKVCPKSGEVYLHNQQVTGNCLVSPVPMSRGFHHFEVTLLHEPSEGGATPPMIALTTASPYDPPQESNFKLDLLRFWPRNEGVSQSSSTLVHVGDNIGWGIIYPNDELSDGEEQIVIFYLTINRDVVLTRGLIQPYGGMFATVVMPYGCTRVKMNFDAMNIYKHPFTRSNVEKLYKSALDLIREEEKMIASGDHLPYENKRLPDFYKPLPISRNDDDIPHQLGYLDDVYKQDTKPRPSSKLCVIL